MNNDTPRQVQLRQDLQQSRQQHQGKSYLVVKDPVARRYFRFTESQGSILELLANPTDAETVAALASEKLGANVSAATITAFCDSLESKNLLDTPAVRERLGDVGGLRRESSVLYKQVASFNPERIFDWLLPRTQWAYTPAFQIFGCLLILCGVTIFSLHWADLTASTPNLLNVWTILMVWPIVFSVSAYHEFSHGLTCRHYGGHVKEMGFILIYFSPAFYCDVSDAWMFPERRHRMFVTLAGGYSQLMFWGLCTIVWRITEPDTFINHIMVIVVVFSGLQTLFNFNPLIKLDGYYMLSDYLEVPNLRAKAFSTLWNWITRNPKRKAFHEERAQLLYGVCAVVFSSTLLVAAYSAIYTWSTDNWATAGLVGFAVFSTLTLRRTAVESMSGLKSLVSHVAVKKYRNASIVVIALLLSIFVHWELKITANFKILPENEHEVRAETAGIVTEVKVHEGDRVHKGDVLAITTDFDKQNELPRIKGELEEKRITLERLKAGPRPEEIRQLQSRIATKQAELDNARQYAEERKRREEILAQRRAELKKAQQHAENTRKLYEEGLQAKILADDAQNAVEVKQSEIDEAEASIRVLAETNEREANLRTKELAALNSDLALLKLGNRAELIRETQAQVDTLSARLDSVNQEIGKSEIRAPIDGTVATPFPERLRNTKLAAGQVFLRLVDTTGLIAEMLVPEKNLAVIKTGNVVWMKARSLSEEDFEGRVGSIAVVAQTENGQQMVKVRARLSNANDILKPETTGVARIYCGQRRIIDVMTYRIRGWIRTEFLTLLP